jgi:hypothetical protein
MNNVKTSGCIGKAPSARILMLCQQSRKLVKVIVRQPVGLSPVPMEAHVKNIVLDEDFKKRATSAIDASTNVRFQ